ncbi:(Fe-S)-binding protein [Microbacterium sp. ZW T5_45]|uniref:(Fe-S)-binding protein n=1 Tax=Microbacterium sp. ZW T5_45 TaxID=3378080 RepID=UPI003853BC12
MLRREIAAADARGDRTLAAELRDDYDYDGVQTCAVDGMCGVACPVDINTGDLVRRLRAESAPAPLGAVWGAAAKHWGTATRTVGAALTVADALPAPLVRAATRAGRAVLGADTVPLYTDDVPAGGRARPAGEPTSNGPHVAGAPGDPAQAQAVFFATCMSTMFHAAGQTGSTAAFLTLAERAGVTLVVPKEAGSLCCGTPWKSKGYAGGFATMTERVLTALNAATDGGRLPVVCDAASCTEGLETMQNLAASARTDAPHLRFVDATTFAAEHFLPALTVTAPVGSVAVHHTCATTQLGASGHLDGLAEFVATEVYRPTDWGCCAFAGDRGMLHPELTASATAREAAEIRQRAFDAHVSANRACEIGMTRATGRTYTHVLELVEAARRH